MIRPVAVLVAVLAVTGCSGNPSRSECGPIVEHLVEVFTAGKLGEDDAKVSKDYRDNVTTWRRLLDDDKDATHEALMQLCTSQIASGAVSCIMTAKNERALSGCLGQ